MDELNSRTSTLNLLKGRHYDRMICWQYSSGENKPFISFAEPSLSDRRSWQGMAPPHLSWVLIWRGAIPF